MKAIIQKYKKILWFLILLLAVPLMLFLGSKTVEQQAINREREKHDIKPLTKEQVAKIINSLPKGKLSTNVAQSTLVKGMTETTDPTTGKKTYEIAAGTEMQVSICVLKSGKIMHIVTPKLPGNVFSPPKVTCERLRSEESKK